MTTIMKASRSTSLAAAVLAAMGLCGISAPAQGGVAVSPLKQEISVKPGQTQRFRITVTNNVREPARAKPETVHLALADVAVSENGRLSFMEAGSLPQSASRWIKLSATEAVVEAGQSKVVEGAVTAPHQASGEFYSAVMVTLGSQDKTDTGVSVTYRVASGLFVTVTGRSFPKRAGIARCEVVWPTPDETSTMWASQPASQPAGPEPTRVSVVLKNTGQARFDATGKVSIADSHSRTVFAAPLTSKRACVFGGDSRLFEAPLDRPLAVGQYVVRVEMDYQSGWAKAHHRLPLEITPEKADLLKAAQKAAQQAKDLPVQVTPEKLSVTMPARAFRSLRLALRNNSEDALRCTAKLVFEGDRPVDGSWVTIAPEEFELPKFSQKTLELVIRLPAGAAMGQHTCTVLIEADQGRTDSMHFRVPVEVGVKAEE